jgi:rhodanese-related sulfurtransferase
MVEENFKKALFSRFARVAKAMSSGHRLELLEFLAELEQCLGELDPEQEIVAYCRGAHCMLAFDAVALLRKKGRTASRFDGGLPRVAPAGARG